VSGLIAACEFSAAGWRVVVLGEGHRVGGRMATRRIANGIFNLGARFLNMRSERFEKLAAGWLEAGLVEEWTRAFADSEGKSNDDGHPRHRGSEGTISIPRYLARGLDVRTGERAVALNVQDGAWEVRTESGTRENGAALLLTAPVPQSLALVESGNPAPLDESRRELESISYAPSLPRASGAAPRAGGRSRARRHADQGRAAGLGTTSEKGISAAPGVTIHAGSQWIREPFETDEAKVPALLLAFAGERLALDLSSRLVETSLIRWRYGWVTQPHPEHCLMASEEPSLVFAGDAFGEAKVEGATLSGLAAADHLLGRKE
jgi:renalase